MRGGLFGWDLPPGCRESDIPGNRPEDLALEDFEDKLGLMLRHAAEDGINLDREMVHEMIDLALDEIEKFIRCWTCDKLFTKRRNERHCTKCLTNSPLLRLYRGPVCTSCGALRVDWDGGEWGTCRDCGITQRIELKQ